MAALPEIRVPEVVELRHLRADDLNPLLEEESITWRSVLSWDFSASAELVRRFVRIQALNGFALVMNGRVIGYTYYVCEDRKALLGDVYILREFSSTANEDLLLSAVLRVLTDTVYLGRIEAQLMMLHGPSERPMPYGANLQVYPRNFMVADLDDAGNLPEGKAAASYLFARWTEARQEETAQLIASAYQRHIDSSINDQYRSANGAKRFLMNIVQYPGCGSFYGPGSILAETTTHQLTGICLSSLVASDIGHITQICVAPELKGAGIGYELMRRSMVSLADRGCRKASLTVTASNQEAIQLYQRMGFRAMRRFAAYVWEGF
jgi:ribosomal protein S18 acetylase RimI-like enzyme